MATITDKLYELESSLELLISKNKTEFPVKNNLGDIVSHLDYIIELMGLMIGEDTYESIKEEQRKGYNGIYDRVDTINKILQSGEISGDVDLFPLTITENGNYSAGLGKGFTKVIAEIDAKNEREIKLIEGSSSYRNPNAHNVGDSVFAYRSSLKEIDLPACTSIGSSAFYNCSSLNEVSFPVCTSIGNYAFQNCFSLNTVSFPACISIGENAFQYCYSLSKVSFPACTIIGRYAFQNCSLSNVSFPSCTIIEDGVFAWCYSLNTVSFPACTNIGSYAFRDCSSLREVYLNSSSFTSLITPVDDAFPTYSIISFYVPASLIETYQTDSYWSAASSRFVAMN